ncbi:NAD(P)H-hydrate dehydratase [Luteimonas sp. SX5]|uniref:Bifunctional NAD(P)H-hydrate repair enzyme n=1 Tax=Luteimonas galliterrae TaxID=2940486 RepID=A0ABT0MEJ0_9GAMM|nr:NAD(P)H-hydrate dehydratase [Luteimonas galliterrae]MCL1633279.1 NAD(P)H-hydrate dehydratase [Luteimonas galliterrae]
MNTGLALYGIDGVRKIEAQATAALGDDGFALMARAGEAAWRYLLRHWPQAQRIVVACGPGNNGGDGYVLARHALASGRAVRVVRARGHAPRSELCRRASAEFAAAGGNVEIFEHAIGPADAVVDAIFGIGFSREPDAETAALIAAIGRTGASVLSLDVPSGVDADRGATPGAAIVAARTLQFMAAHAGLYTGDALDHAGVADLDGLGVEAAAFAGVGEMARLAVRSDLSRWLKPRPRNSHKGGNGHVLCVGGDEGMGGAIALCAEAALRCGAGLVSVASRASHASAMLARRPEIMARGVQTRDDLRTLIERADVIALGPGLGKQTWGRDLFGAALDSGKPCVIDADALNLLAAAPRASAQAVLTPHPGEAARLLASDTSAVQRDRYGAARELAQKYGCPVVLKGAGSIVAASHATPRVIGAGNPGMASGGMGDVLTGAIAALLAQGLPAFDAAVCGALLHASAGDDAAREGERGLLASDLLPALRKLANP